MKYFLKRLFTIAVLVVFYLVRPVSLPDRDIFALTDHAALDQGPNKPCHEASFVFVDNELSLTDHRSQLNRQTIHVQNKKENYIHIIEHLYYDPDVDTPILCLKLPPSRFTAYS